MRLSGLMRLWIVSALAIWGAGIAHLVYVTGGIALSPVPSTRQICFLYYPAAADVTARYDDNGNPIPSENRFARFAPSPPTGENCLLNRALQRPARDWYWHAFWGCWGMFWPWWIAPIAMGLLFVVGRWVWRGFKPA